jgi:hypothetical protein
MKALPESSIDIVNDIATLICREMCGSDKCGLCQLFSLRTGIDMAFGDKLPIEEVKATMIQNFRMLINEANDKYDNRYEFHEAV